MPEQIDYKFIHFEETATFWFCKNNKSGAILGRVEWYYPWKQYIFEPSGSALFSADCLADIQHFMGQLAQERKK